VEVASPPSARERLLYAGLAALLVLVSLATLANRPLFNPDEGRYAEIPREMLSGGDWVIPHLNGLDYIEKPPLQYWATALMYRVFGVSEFSARLYTALTALGTMAWVWFLGLKLWGREVGWRCAAVICGMLMLTALGQLLSLDMSLAFYMTASLTGFLMAQQFASSQRRWMMLAWAAAALGMLTKGLIAAAIPTAVLIIYSLWSRDFSPWRKLHWKWGLPLFLVLVVPWHWLAALRLPDFLQFYFVREHFARYLTPIADRAEPWWFFGWVFLAGTLPWTVSSLRVLIGGWRAHRAAVSQFNPHLFLWIWVVFILVFFSLSDSKLMPYILPVMPALALLIGAQPTPTLKQDFLLTAVLTTLAGLAMLVASLNWPAMVASSDRSASFLPLAKPLTLIAVLVTATGVFVWVQGARDATRAGVFLGVGWCLAWLLLVRAAALLAPIYSGVALASALPAADRDAPLYSVRTYNQSLTFYLQRAVTLVQYRGELDYGLRRMPSAEIEDLDEFIRRWDSQSRAFAVMDKRTFDSLRARGLPMVLAGANVEHVLVARQ
jgi:4-amino-4-deoxy-L-arabinose transferase-like glycosyltransferase